MNKKLIFSIIIVLIALAGVFAYQKYGKNEEISSNIDTSDWLTYRNEEYGFELKYPKEWVVKQEIDNNGHPLVIYGKKLSEFYDNLCGLSVWKTSKKIGVGLGYINNEKSVEYINGLEFEKDVYQDEEFPDRFLVSFQKNIDDSWFTIEYNYSLKSGNCEEKLKNIIYSFSFI